MKDFETKLYIQFDNEEVQECATTNNLEGFVFILTSKLNNSEDSSFEFKDLVSERTFKMFTKHNCNSSEEYLEYLNNRTDRLRFSDAENNVKEIENYKKFNKDTTFKWLTNTLISIPSDEIGQIINQLCLISLVVDNDFSPYVKDVFSFVSTLSNDQTTDFCLRIAENVITIETLELLKEFDAETQWLNEYKEGVIKDLEQELKL